MKPSFIDLCLEIFPRVRRKQLVFTDKHNATITELDAFISKSQQLLTHRSQNAQVVGFLHSICTPLQKLRDSAQTAIQNEIKSLFKHYAPHCNAGNAPPQTLLNAALWNGKIGDIAIGNERLTVMKSMLSDSDLNQAEISMLEAIIEFAETYIGAFNTLDNDLAQRITDTSS